MKETDVLLVFIPPEVKLTHFDVFIDFVILIHFHAIRIPMKIRYFFFFIKVPNLY